MIHHNAANKTLIALAVMLMIFCIGGWLTGLATIGNDAIRKDSKVEAVIVDALEDNEKVDVIVILKEPPTRDIASRRNIQSEILNSNPNFEVKYQYTSFNGFAGKIDIETLNQIRFNPDIEKIYLNKKLKITLDVSAPLINADYIADTKYQDAYLKGKGLSICILDTGVNYNHPALAGRVINGWDFVNNDSDAMDDHPQFHGTHVAGIVASNDTTYTGIAPESNIVAVRVCDEYGNCNSLDTLAGIDWCINNASTYNISVISMSLGSVTSYNSSNCPSDFDNDVNNAVANGIFVVASSGNYNNHSGISFPGCAANITSVGATTDSDSIWESAPYGTNTGDLLDLLAPGSGIISTISGSSFDDKTGTSQATPHVAGAAAIIYQHANLSGEIITPEEVKNKLINNGINITDPDNNLSFPRIDVKESVLSSRLIIDGRASPYPRSNANIEFYANYTNRTDNSAISDGNCSIEFNDVSANMTYNASEKVYQYFRNFTSKGIYSYNITCNQSDFETLIESTIIEIVQGSENCTFEGSNVDWNVTAENGSWCVGEDLIINQSNINISAGAEFVLNDTNITLIGASINYVIDVSDSANFMLKNVVVKGVDKNNKRLDIELYGYGDIINSTFENSRLRILGNKTHDINNSIFKYYSYFIDETTNNIINSNFTDRSFFEDSSVNNIQNCNFSNNISFGNLIQPNDNPNLEISNSVFGGELLYIVSKSVINFTGISNITAPLDIRHNPRISGSVDMPNSALMSSDNLTRFYPVQVYYNDGTTPYPNKAVTLKDSNGSTLFEGTTDSNGTIEINLTLNTTNYGIGNFSVEVNPTEDIGLLTDTPISLQSSDDVPDGGGNGGGGGGGSTTTVVCNESWVCSPWSLCINAIQTRTCVDVNNCNTTIDKPNETQSCEEPFMPKLTEGGSGSGSDSGGGDDLHIHEDENTSRECCLWGLCWFRFAGLCWYWWFLILFMLIISLIVWWNMEKKKKKKKIQKAMMDAFGIDWTLKHLHLK